MFSAFGITHAGHKNNNNNTTNVLSSF